MTAEFKITEGALLKYSNEGPGSFSGYAAVFGNVDHQKDRIVPGAFKKHLPEFIKRGYVAFNHDRMPIATIKAAHEDSRGLHVEGVFHSDTEAQRIRSVVAERVARGASVGMSIGYFTIAERKARDANELVEIKPFEASILSSYPANELAGVTAVKELGGSMDQLSIKRQMDAIRAKHAPPGGHTWASSILGSLQFKEARAWGKSGVIEIKAAGDPVAGFTTISAAARIDQHAFKPSGVLQLLTRTQSATAQLVYTQAVYPLVNAAAFIAEGAAKPEMQPRWSAATVKMEEVATWCTVTTQALEDVPSLEQTINVDLQSALYATTADRVINGTGTSPDLLGILATPGVQAVAFITGTSTLDSLFAAIAAVEVPGYGTVNGIVLNPADAFTLATLKIPPAGAYALAPQLPLVVTDAHLAAGTAIVGDWRYGTLYTRGDVRVDVGYVNDDIFHDRMTIAPSQRVGLALSRPQAFAKVALA